MKKYLLFTLLLLIFSNANATHIMGGEITYTLVDTVNRLYKIRLVIYRDCAGSNNQVNQNTQQVVVRNMCTNTTTNVTVTKVSGGNNGVDKTSVCTGVSTNCGGGSISGLSQYIWEGNYNFPTTCDSFKMSFQIQARNSAVNNVVLAGNNTWFYTDSYIRFQPYKYNSSTRNDNLLLSVNFCNNTKSKFSFYAPDPNFDSVTYELVTPRELNGANMVYTGSPLPSASHPTFDCGYNFNTQTGEYRFKPNAVQNSLVAVKTNEYKNGVLVGYVIREAQFVVQNTGGCGELSLDNITSTYCTTKNTVATSISGFGCYIDTAKVYDLVFCEGTPIELFIKYKNAGKVITNMDTYSGYGTMTDLDSDKSDSIRDFKFVWGSPVYGIHTISLSLNNCPPTGAGLKYSNSVSFVIRVLHSPRPSRDSIFYCLAGGAVDLNLNNVDSGVTYKWNHKTGFTYPNPSDSTKILVALTKDTTYIISWKYYGDTCASCNNFDTVVVKYVPDFGYSITPKVSNICVTGSQQLTVNPDNSAPPYTYKWLPFNTLYHPVTGLVLDTPTMNIKNPIADPPAGVFKYAMQVISSTGCTLKDTFTVNVSDSIPYISGLANRYQYCSCDTTQLNTVPGYGSCGVPSSPVIATFSNYTQGAGAINSPSTVNGYPSMFGNFNGPSVKHRIMYKNSELAALGITNKNIKSIAFLPNTIPGINYYKFVKIYMSCTSSDTIAASISPTLVYTNDSIWITPTWITFPLIGNGYNLSNNDNLIVEFCFTNPITGWANTTMKCDNTAFNSIAWDYGTSVCASTAWKGISNIRPQTRFNSGGIPVYSPTSYAWTPTAGLSASNIPNPIATVCTPTDYIVTAFRGACSNSDTLHIHADTSLKIIARADTFICSNAFVQLNATYTSTPVPGNSFTFLWRAIGGDTSLKDTTLINPMVRPNKTVVYVVKMMGGSCDVYDTVVVTRGTELNLTMTKKDLTCVFINGQAKVKANNGNSPYTYNWNVGGVIDSLIGLNAGVYKVTVTDKNGCMGNDSITLNTITPYPVLSFNKSNVKCFGESNGAARVKTTNANIGPFSYNWTPAKPNQDSIFNLNAQWYTVIVYDSATSCSTKDSIQITQPNKLTVNADSTDVSCFGGSNGTLTAIVSGGTTTYSYSWSDIAIGNSATATNKPMGTYKVTVTDANGCKDSSTTSINQPTILSSTKTQTNVLCFNGTTGMAKVTSSGGTAPYTKIWYKITPLIPVLPPPINLDSIVNLPAGTYYCATLDNKSCPKNDTFVITQPTDISGSVNIIQQSQCAGFNNGIARHNSSGGVGPYTYTWSSGTSFNGDTAFGLSKGANSVTVKDANLCTKVFNFNITEPNPIVTQDHVIKNVSCFGGSDASGWIEVTSGGTAPFNFTWSPSQPNNDTIFGLSANTYYVTVYDAVGVTCFKKDTLVITQPTKLTASTNSIVPVVCNGQSNGQATATASGGTPTYSYAWDNAINTASNTTLNANNHQVVVTDSKGCKDTAYALITQPAVLNVSLIDTNPTKCYGSKNGQAIVGVVGGNYPYNYNWNPSASENDSIVDTLFAGIHKVIVTDNKGCKDTLSGIVITQPDSLTLNMVQTTATCYDSITGKAKVITIGGTGLYTYLWNTGETIDSIIKHAGNYSVTVKDANLCSKVGNITILQPTIFSSVIKIDSATCNGTATGKVKITISGNNPTYSYLWNEGTTKDSIVNKIAGTYTLTTTDSKGCKKIDVVSIKEPLPLIANITAKSNIVCFGQSNGTATVTANGGNPSYSYAWSGGGSITNTKNTLSLGFNTVTVTDLKGCNDTAGVNITQPTKLILSLVDTQSINCWFDTLGVGIVATTGGVYPYVYNWGSASAQTDSIADNLPVGTHKCIVTDINGCKDSIMNIVIKSPDSMTFAMSISPVKCHDSLNGRIKVVVTGGTGTKTYLWSTGETIDSIKGKGPGTYTLTVTDQFNCKQSKSTVFTQPSAWTDTLYLDSAKCFGDPSGKARVKIGGNNPPYTYIWNEGTTVDSIENKIAGLYSLTITDSKGCQKVDNVMVPQRSLFEANMLSSTNVKCFGDSNGVATVSATGGLGPYFYLWNNGGGTNATKINLKAGFHIVSCTDSKGCTDTAGILITEPVKLSIALIDTDAVKCWGDTNGVAKVGSLGGTQPYTYSWLTSSYKTDSIVNNLKTGIHKAVVIDNNLCKDTLTNINITTPDTMKFIFTPKMVNCKNGSDGRAKVSVTGGYGPYSYAWNTGESIDSIMNKNANSYKVTVTDFNSCIKVGTIAITEPTGLFSYNKSQDSVTCFGGNDGKAYIHILGGTKPYVYSWNSSPIQTDTIASNLSSGQYIVQTTDAKSCIKLDTIFVREPVKFNTTINIDNSVTCYNGNDGKVTVSAIGGNGGNLYKITKLINNISTSYQSSPVFNNLDSGMRTVTVTDMKGCADTQSFVVVQSDTILNSIGKNNASCIESANGNAFVFNISGGNGSYSFLWSDNQTTDTAKLLLALKNYYVTITDIKGCIKKDTVYLDTNYVLRIDTHADSVSCYNGMNGIANAITSNGLAPYTYTWNSSPVQTTDTAFNLRVGNYMVTVKDANNCKASKGVFVPQPSPIVINITENQPSCYGDNNGVIKAIATGSNAPYSYQWNTNPVQNADSATNLAAGKYTVIVTDLKGCIDSLSYTLKQPDKSLFIEKVKIQNISCNLRNDGLIEIKATGGFSPYKFTWSNTPDDTPKIANLESGITYFVTLTDSKGCKDTASFVLSQPDELLFDNITMKHISCPGDRDGQIKAIVKGGTATNASPYMFSLDSIKWQDNRLFLNLDGGTYFLYVRDANGCMNKTQVKLIEPEAMKLSIDPKDTMIELGSSVVLNPIITSKLPISSSKFSYYWSPSEGLDCQECSNPVATTYNTKIYKLLLTYNEKCYYNAEAIIKISDSLDFFVPSGFTPNGDGNNDIFNVYGKNILTVDMLVYNRYGERVFTGKDHNPGWDGFYNGKIAPQDVYTYSIEVTFLGGQKRSKGGSITLIR